MPRSASSSAAECTRTVCLHVSSQPSGRVLVLSVRASHHSHDGLFPWYSRPGVRVLCVCVFHQVHPTCIQHSETPSLVVLSSPRVHVSWRLHGIEFLCVLLQGLGRQGAREFVIMSERTPYGFAVARQLHCTVSKAQTLHSPTHDHDHRFPRTELRQAPLETGDDAFPFGYLIAVQRS